MTSSLTLAYLKKRILINLFCFIHYNGRNNSCPLNRTGPSEYVLLIFCMKNNHVYRGGHWGALNTTTPQKILPNTASPQYIVLVWWSKGPHMTIPFKIIRFYLKKNSETNTSQVQNHGYSTDAFGSRSFCLNFTTRRSMKMTAKLRWKVAAALPVQECFREVICPEIMEMEYRR